MEMLAKINEGISQMELDFIQFSISENVAYLTLDRSDKSNAYNSKMLDEIEYALQLVLCEEYIYALVLRSSSGNFCAGADLDEIKQRNYSEILSLKSKRVFNLLSQLPVITIAVVTGVAVAGGFEMVLACDFVVASDNSRFWLPEVKLGLIPAAGGISRLGKILGPMKTKEIVVFGKKIEAEEAYDYGLITKLSPELEIDKEAELMIEKLSQLPISSVKIAKMAINDTTWTNQSSIDVIGQAFLNEVLTNVEQMELNEAKLNAK